MYSFAELDKQSEYWSDIILGRNWSMLEKLNLGNYGNTQASVGSPMIPSIYSLTWIGRIWLIYIYVICA